MKLKPAEHGFPPSLVRDTAIRLRHRFDEPAELEGVELGPLLECSQSAMLITDALGRILLANRAALRLLATDREQLDHTYVQEHVAPLDCERSLFESSLSGRRSIDVALPDGRRARATFTALPSREGGTAHTCITLELMQERPTDLALESVGRLAAELAHDINNQLSAALNYVFILRRRLASDRALTTHVEELQSTAWRAAALASGLKLLGRKRGNEPEVLRLDDLLEAMEPLLLQAANGVKLELRLPRGLPEVRVPRAYAEQLLLIVTLSAAGRARPNSTIVIAVETRPLGFTGSAGSVRITWHFRHDRGGTGERRAPGSVRTQATLRRALKRCSARLGHELCRIWVEFAVSATDEARLG